MMAVEHHDGGGGSTGGVGRSARRGRRPGRAGWLGWQKAEAQLRLAVVAQKEGRGEWGGRGGRRGGSRLGQNSKEILFEFQLILEFGRTLENCTRRFRRNLDMGIFPKIFYAIPGF
jgi:hypothetical protein